VSRRHKKKAHANHERWLVSYADFITLLFAFFVVLYASSQADKKKAAQVAASIKGAFQQMGVFTGSSPNDLGVPGSPGPLHPELTDSPLRVVKVAGADDKIFRLDRTDTGECASLVTDRKELAAIRHK